MKTRICFIFLLFQGFILLVEAQDALPVFIRGNPNHFLGKYLEEHIDAFIYNRDTICVESICYVRFNIDKQGRVINAKCSASTPKYLADFFVKMVESMDSLWTPQMHQGKPIESTAILLPIYYYISPKGKKTLSRAREGFWHNHWFETPPEYDSTAKGMKHQAGMIQPYIVMHSFFVRYNDQDYLMRKSK
jgi:hypothetical protein